MTMRYYMPNEQYATDESKAQRTDDILRRLDVLERRAVLAAAGCFAIVLEAIPDGRGVHMIDGKMQDDATWKQCKVMVELAEMLDHRLLDAALEGEVELLQRLHRREARFLNPPRHRPVIAFLYFRFQQRL